MSSKITDAIHRHNRFYSDSTDWDHMRRQALAAHLDRGNLLEALQELDDKLTLREERYQRQVTKLSEEHDGLRSYISQLESVMDLCGPDVPTFLNTVEELRERNRRLQNAVIPVREIWRMLTSGDYRMTDSYAMLLLQLQRAITALELGEGNSS